MKSTGKYPTIKQLRYFTALADVGHFGRAAESCFVSQSAFSSAIQDLEALLHDLVGLVALDMRDEPDPTRWEPFDPDDFDEFGDEDLLAALFAKPAA